MQIAKSYVYRNLDTEDDGTPKPSYVGRSPRGNFVRVGKPGQAFTDEQVADLGLDDLEDHTDYDALLAVAIEAGAPVTFRREDGSIGVKVKGKEVE